MVMFFTLGAYAQTATVTGVIKDTYGDELIGANVLVKGTTNGTITDINGRFSLSMVNPQATLVVSYIGYINQEVALKGNTTVNVVLEEDSKTLSEVVVIGYGTMDKKELTSAISHISSKDFLSIGAMDPAMMVQGKIAGVSITNIGAADPNSGSSIQVRGASSRTAGLGPLIVIDGVPGGNLQNINPNDIASIDVLKDGAASAIYGTRGSNGVILVTTKKGNTDGKLTTIYNGYVTIDVMKKELDVLSADQFRTYRKTLNGAPDNGYSTNWLDEVSRTGFAHNHTLTISGGNAQSSARASVDFRKANGIDLRSDRQEYGGRLSLDHKTKSGLLQFMVNIAPRIINRNNADWEVFDKALVANPTSPVMDPNNPGAYNSLRTEAPEWNPVEKMKLDKNYTEQKLLDWDVTAKLDIPVLFRAEKPSSYTLTTQLTLAQQINDKHDYWFRPSTSNQSIANGFEGEASQSYKKDRQESLEWLVNFRTELNGHNIAFMGGYSYQYWMYNGFNAENKNFSSDVLTWDNLGNGDYMKEDGRTGMGSYRNDATLIAFFGRVSYDYKQRYLLTASLRYEGSSKFGANNKWGYFSALSAGWRISDESFMKEVSWVKDLKVRADLGVTGNQDFSSYKSLATMGNYPDVYYQGKYYSGWGIKSNVNPDLKWEKGINWNVGVDFSLFDWLSGSINYYNRKQQDLLGNYQVPTPPFLFDNMFVNVGTMRNSGIEIELNMDVIKTRDFSYSIGLVGASNNNKFVSFSNRHYEGQDFYDTGDMPNPGKPGPLQRIEKGKRIGNYYTYKYAGVDESGRWMVWNHDNTEIILLDDATESDKRITGNGLPKFTGSMSNNFTYRNWDLSLYFRGAFGYDLYDVHEYYYGLQSGMVTGNVLKLAYSKNYPITVDKGKPTDYFLQRGDHVKLDVISLGYRFPMKQSRLIENIRLYGTIRNAFTFTKFGGVDPTTYQTNGLTPGMLGSSTKNYYPSTRQYLVGVQIDF